MLETVRCTVHPDSATSPQGRPTWRQHHTPASCLTHAADSPADFGILGIQISSRKVVFGPYIGPLSGPFRLRLVRKICMNQRRDAHLESTC